MATYDVTAQCDWATGCGKILLDDWRLRTFGAVLRMEEYYKYDEESTYLQMHAVPATATQNGGKKVQIRLIFSDGIICLRWQAKMG
jgi:hypothetical protein